MTDCLAEGWATDPHRLEIKEVGLLVTQGKGDPGMLIGCRLKV